MDPRYLAPEFLERTTDIETMDFATLKKADMYSFALVLWEIARRCWIQGLCFNLLHDFLCMCVCVYICVNDRLYALLHACVCNHRNSLVIEGVINL